MRWVLAHCDPHPAHSNQLWSVHPQRGNGCSTNRCQRDDFRGVLIPFKVVRPGISLRMKERNRVAGGWVGCHFAIGFEPITRRTGQTGILEDRESAHGTGHDVLDLKDRNTQLFGRPAIRAAVGETVTNFVLKFNRNVGTHVRLTATRWCKVNLARVLTVVR